MSGGLFAPVISIEELINLDNSQLDKLWVILTWYTEGTNLLYLGYGIDVPTHLARA